MSAQDNLNPRQFGVPFNPDTADYLGTAHSFGHTPSPDSPEVWNEPGQTAISGSEAAREAAPGSSVGDRPATSDDLRSLGGFRPNETLGQKTRNSRGFIPGLS